MTDREDLEDLVFGYEALRAKWQQAEAQRDTLLAALREIAEYSMTRKGHREIARAAIAEVEGEPKGEPKPDLPDPMVPFV